MSNLFVTSPDVTLDAGRQPVVAIKDGGVYADSRDVAAFFAKDHKHVLRDIRDLLKKEPNLRLLKFEEFKIKDLTGESTSHYEMDRDGFTLLAMVRHRLGLKAPRGWGWLTNPRRAAYNRVYSRTTISFWALLRRLFR